MPLGVPAGAGRACLPALVRFQPPLLFAITYLFFLLSHAASKGGDPRRGCPPSLPLLYNDYFSHFFASLSTSTFPTSIVGCITTDTILYSSFLLLPGLNFDICLSMLTTEETLTALRREMQPLLETVVENVLTKVRGVLEEVEQQCVQGLADVAKERTKGLTEVATEREKGLAEIDSRRAARS